MAQIAKIAVSAATYAIDRPYDYLVPSQLEGALGVGMRAAVPFGRGNKACDGVVLALEEREDGSKLKPILAALDEELSYAAHAVKSGKWFDRTLTFDAASLQAK